MERKALERLEPGLAARWYYDPAHYARELEVFWYRKWIAVARSEELRAPGDWRVVRIGTQSLVIVSGEKGELRAFHNTCRHRGSVLCTEEAGNFVEGTLGSREADALRRRHGQRLQPLERQRQVRAAARPDHRVNFVDDHRTDGAEHGAAAG